MRMETTFDYTTKEVAYFSSDENRWIKKIRSLAEQYPDLVRITQNPETNDHCICAEVPVSWFKLSPPRKVSVDDKGRADRIRNLQLAREKKAEKKAREGAGQ